MYRINKWAETFENADTRKRQRLGWFLCPSGNDSAGYLELMSHGPDGVAAFGVFLAICQWSATRGRSQRGEVTRNDGRPMSIDLLATTIRVPVSVVEKSLPLLCHPDVGWMINENTGKTEQPEYRGKAFTEEPAGSVPVACQSHAKESSIVKGEGEGEGEGEATADETVVSGGGGKKEIATVEQEETRTAANHIIQSFTQATGLRAIVTKKRLSAVRERIRDPVWRENWMAALEKASQNPALYGDNDRGWTMDVEWFLRPDTVAKILEGKYDNWKRTKSDSAAERREQANVDAFAQLRLASGQ